MVKLLNFYPVWWTVSAVKMCVIWISFIRDTWLCANCSDWL